jgi:hypothetical protein
MIVCLNLAHKAIVRVQVCCKVQVCMYVYMFIAVLSLSQSQGPYLKEHTWCSVVKGCNTLSHTLTCKTKEERVSVFVVPTHSHK